MQPLTASHDVHGGSIAQSHQEVGRSSVQEVLQFPDIAWKRESLLVGFDGNDLRAIDADSIGERERLHFGGRGVFVFHFAAFKLASEESGSRRTNGEFVLPNVRRSRSPSPR